MLRIPLEDMPSLRDILVSRIRETGPITVAEYMELALYHPERGYYSTATRRSGRAGDFYTSVDVGPLFGQLLAVQVAGMWTVLRERGASQFHLVEAGAGDGRLTRDVLDAIETEWPDLYEVVHVTLVERSAAARGRHEETIGHHPKHVPLESTADMPAGIMGVVLANELLDALPVHVVAMTAAGLLEVHVGEAEGALRETLRPVSNPAIQRYVETLGVELPRGGRAEVGLAGVDWVRRAAGSIARGFLLLIDYGHHARELFSAHADGTLTGYRAHMAGAVHWLDCPGESDLTAHVNLTAVGNAARAAGLTRLGEVDQTYFLTALGLADRLDDGSSLASIRTRLGAGTLIAPGGLGSTMKVIAFGKEVGAPALRGFSVGRLT